MRRCRPAYRLGREGVDELIDEGGRGPACEWQEVETRTTASAAPSVDPADAAIAVAEDVADWLGEGVQLLSA